jgi:hypothetical protein
MNVEFDALLQNQT